MAITHYTPSRYPYFTAVYQDEHMLVLNKPSGLLSVPGKASEHRDSLQTRITTVYPEAKLVHRLDMATSGLMLMAFGKTNQRQLAKQFEQRRVNKTYHALIWGQPQQDCGCVELPLRCDWPNRPKQKVDLHGGRAAITHWRVLQRWPNASLVELQPITGRSHQLRVHMLSLGHPILGDRLYAHPAALAAKPRLQLHASRLRCYHPHTGKITEFQCPAPFATSNRNAAVPPKAALNPQGLAAS